MCLCVCVWERVKQPVANNVNKMCDSIRVKKIRKKEWLNDKVKDKVKWEEAVEEDTGAVHVL